MIAKSVNKVLLPLAITLDAIRIGRAIQKDRRKKTTKSTVKAASSVAGGWGGGFGGIRITQRFHTTFVSLSFQARMLAPRWALLFFPESVQWLEA